MFAHYHDLFMCYRSNVYDTVVLHSHKYRKSMSDFPLVSSTSEMPSLTKSQDIKANTVELQENPSYVPSTSDPTLQEDYAYVCTSDFM